MLCGAAAGRTRSVCLFLCLPQLFSSALYSCRDAKQCRGARLCFCCVLHCCATSFDALHVDVYSTCAVHTPFGMKYLLRTKTRLLRAQPCARVHTGEYDHLHSWSVPMPLNCGAGDDRFVCSKQFDRKTKKLTPLPASQGYPSSTEPIEQTDKVRAAFRFLVVFFCLFVGDQPLKCLLYMPPAFNGLTIVIQLWQCSTCKHEQKKAQRERIMPQHGVMCKSSCMWY